MKPDPIFALIETHRQREAAFSAVIDEFDPIEKRLWQKGLHASDRTDDPEFTSYNRRYEAAEKASGRAMCKMCNQKPRTLAGLLALLEHLKPLLDQSFAGEFADGRTDNLADTLIEAVRAFALPARVRRTDHHAIAAE